MCSRTKDVVLLEMKIFPGRISITIYPDLSNPVVNGGECSAHISTTDSERDMRNVPKKLNMFSVNYLLQNYFYNYTEYSTHNKNITNFQI